MSSPCDERHQNSIAPPHPLFPLIERHQFPSLRFHFPDQLGGPWIVLSAFRAHLGIGRPKAFGMPRDTSGRVQIDCLERTDYGPAQSQSVAHHPVNVGDGRKRRHARGNTPRAALHPAAG